LYLSGNLTQKARPVQRNPTRLHLLTFHSGMNKLRFRHEPMQKIVNTLINLKLMRRSFKQSLGICRSGLMILLSGSLIICSTQKAQALEPNEILVIANGNNPASVRIAGHYCTKRGVPEQNNLKLDLMPQLTDDITRSDYEKLIAQPIRNKLSRPEFHGRIKCLLTVYGVPFRVGPRNMLEGKQASLAELSEMAGKKTDRLKEILKQFEDLTGSECTLPDANDTQSRVRKLLREFDVYIEQIREKIDVITDEFRKQQLLSRWFSLYSSLYGKTRAQQTAKDTNAASIRLTLADKNEIKRCRELFKKAADENWKYQKRLKAGFYDAIEKVAGIEGVLLRLDADIGNIRGTETGASVDSELSMVMFDDYELYRQQPNELKDRIFWSGTKTLMVARLDGPGEDIAKALVDKALSAEQNGLNGVAYIDSGYSQKKNKPLYLEYDQSLLRAASVIGERTRFKVVSEQTPNLFAQGECPDTALYCGWYSLKMYVDAFDFASGAVGYHIASWEAIDLRDPESTQWCPAMLKDGITATMGAVAEPYLAAFPKPDRFFGQLINGKCLAEAYYRTKPYNSWQMLLIGDPLYTPFR